MALILLFVCVGATTLVAEVADIWVISTDGQNSTRHIYKNGKIGVDELPVPGIARDLAITKDGAYLYVIFSDLGCGRTECNGEGLVAFDLRTKQNVFQINDIPNPATLVINETDSILYMTSGDGLRKYDISTLPWGGRANVLMGQISYWPSPSIDIHGEGIAFTSFITWTGGAYWGFMYCDPEDMFWVTGAQSPPCVNEDAGLPNIPVMINRLCTTI